MSIYYDVVIPYEAEQVLDYTISEGEGFLLYGAEDFAQILSWINLVDLSLEVVPSCRESLHACLDWFGSNRERVEVSLAILRDARTKVYNPLHFGLYQPSKAYEMLIEKVCDGKTGLSRPCNPPRLLSLSCRNFLSEETNESKNCQELD